MANLTPTANIADLFFFPGLEDVPETSGQRLYGIAFSNGTLKVGRSGNAARRLRDHARQSRSYGLKIEGVWLTGELASILAAEHNLIRLVAAEAGGRIASEYFEGVTLERAAQLAVCAIEELPMYPTRGTSTTDDLTGARVMEKVKAGGHSVASVAGDSGMDHSGIYTKIRGDRSFRLSEIERIARVLDVDPRSLIVFAGEVS